MNIIRRRIQIDKDKKYLVMLCNPLEAHPIDAQQFYIDKYDMEEFLDIIEGNEKALIIYPPFITECKNDE